MSKHYSMDEFSFLHNNGETSALIRSINWSATELGPVKNWPQSLRTTLSIIMNSKFPMFLFWGKQHLCFYNDAYRPSLGNNGKHPTAMGKEGKQCWPEIWEFIQPLIDNALAGEEASWNEDQLLPIYRNGAMEDVYWTFSYSPVDDETGKPAGVFVTCTETTEKIKALKIVTDSKEELEFAINAAELGTWDINPATRNLVFNNRLKDWMGTSHNEVALDQALQAVDHKDRERVNCHIEQALDYGSGGEVRVDFKIIHPQTKEERIVRAIGKALFDQHKKPYRFNGVQLDITKEILSRQALTDSEDNFRRLVEQAPVAICVLKEPDYKVTIANDLMLELWGKKAEEMLNKPVFTGLQEAREQGLEELLLHVYTTGLRVTANELAVTMQRQGKPQLVYLNFVYEALKDNNGKIEGIMAVATDVTEQVMARRKIEDAEERIRLAADAVDLGIYDYNIITDDLIGNARAMAILGFHHQRSMLEALMRIHPDDQGIRLRAYSMAKQTGNLFYEVRIIRPDNQVYWIRAEGKIYFDAHKNPIRLLGTLLDITQQRKAEGDLMKAYQRLEIALEVGELGSYEMDLNTGEIMGSDQFKINFGLKSNLPLTFDAVLALIVPEHSGKVQQALQEAIQNKSVYNIEYQIKWPDDSLHWIKSSAKALYDKNLKASIFIGVTADITVTKQLQQQKDDFIGMVSHELKTPVTSIKAYSQILEEILLQKNDLNEAGLVGKIRKQANRLNNLITDLQEIPKTSSGNLKFQLSNFNFNELVQTVVEDTQNITPGFIIETHLSATAKVSADKERLVQVMANLMTNAFKYAPNTQRIIVRTALVNKEIIFSVEDFGVGISPQNQAKVFEQFYRVNSTSQQSIPGLGLGLFISAAIIKQSGGKIWLTSTEAKGTIFYFSLPTVA